MGYADQRFEEGFAVGFERGLANGRRDVTLEVYRLRFKSFTPAHEAVILNADLPQLERLKDDLFTMNHPDELLHAQGSQAQTTG